MMIKDGDRRCVSFAVYTVLTCSYLLFFAEMKIENWPPFESLFPYYFLFLLSRLTHTKEADCSYCVIKVEWWWTERFLILLLFRLLRRFPFLRFAFSWYRRIKILKPHKAICQQEASFSIKYSAAFESHNITVKLTYLNRLCPFVNLWVNLSQNCTLNWQMKSFLTLHTTLYHYFYYADRRFKTSGERLCDGEKISHSQRFAGGWRWKWKSSLLSRTFPSIFLLDFPTVRVKTLFKIEHLKYLLLKTYVTNNFPQSSQAFPASFSEKRFFWDFSVLLSIFLIHCLRAMKLVLLGSNVPLQLNSTLKLKSFNSRNHLSAAEFGSFHRRSSQFLFDILLHNIGSLHFSLKYPLHLKYTHISSKLFVAHHTFKIWTKKLKKK